MSGPHRNFGFAAVAWRTKRGKGGIYIRIEQLPHLRYFWRLEDIDGRLVETSWPEAPSGYRALTPCLDEAREARREHIVAQLLGAAVTGALQ